MQYFVASQYDDHNMLGSVAEEQDWGAIKGKC